MRPWRASSPRSRRSAFMRPGSAPARRRGPRCSSTSRCFTIGSACTRPWATEPRPRLAPAWGRSLCARQPDSLISPLHTKGAGPQVLAHLRAQVLLDLQDLQLGFSDLALGLGDGRHERAPLAFKPGRIALQRGHARDLDQVLLPQLAHPLELLADQLDLALLRPNLVGQALDLLPELGDALPQLRHLPLAGGAADLEQLTLALDHTGHLGVVQAREQLWRKDNLF